MRVIKISTARNVLVFMADSSDHVTGKTGLTLTITASKDGAAFASISPTVTELANGWYNLALTTTHANTAGDLGLHVTGTGADPTDLIIQVVAYDPTDAVHLGLSALPNTACTTNASLLTSGTGTAQLSVAAGLVTVGTNNDKTGYTASTVSDKTGYTLTQTFPTNFASLGISVAGKINGVVLTDTLTTYTGNTVQTGDAYARIGANGAGLTGVTGVTLAASQHVIVDSGTVTTLTNLPAITTDWLTGTGVAASAVTKIQAGLATPTNITAGTITTATNLTNLPAITTDWLTGTGVAASAVTKIQSGLSTYAGGDTSGTTTLLARLTSTRSGYLDNLSAGAVALASQIPANFTTATFASAGVFAVAALVNAPSGSAPTAAANAAAVWDLATSGHTTSGTFGEAMGAAGAAGDPWTTSLPGAYGSGSAGYLLGGHLGPVASVTAAITLPTIPTDWISAAGVSAAAVTKVQSGLSTYAGGAVASVTGNIGGSVASVTDKTGFLLGATGLDAIVVTDPGGVAGHTTLAKMLVAIYRLFYKKSSKTSTQLFTYADNGTTVNTTQAVSDNGAGTESRGAAV